MNIKSNGLQEDLYFILDQIERHGEWLDSMGWGGKSQTTLEAVGMVAGELGEVSAAMIEGDSSENLSLEYADVALRVLGIFYGLPRDLFLNAFYGAVQKRGIVDISLCSLTNLGATVVISMSRDKSEIISMDKHWHISYLLSKLVKPINAARSINKEKDLAESLVDFFFDFLGICYLHMEDIESLVEEKMEKNLSLKTNKGRIK